MAQEHLDRLSAVDAGFLYGEGPSSHAHVGAVMVFEGPPPAYHELTDALRERLHLVPRYRQKLAVPPAGAGRPLWIDDPAFDAEYHVRHSALPSPGGEQALHALAARAFSQPLDRSRPLWEIWMVEGLDENRFALVSKTHHALIDGIAGVDLAQLLLDASPVPSAVEHPDQPWRAAREPTQAEVIATGAAAAVRAGLRAAGQATELLGRPREALNTTVGAAQGLGEVAWAGLTPAPATPLNVEIGPHRRLLGVRAALADLRAVGTAFGGTVNDVVLSVVTGALRSWLRSRGVRTDGLELQALVPVSTRAARDRGALGNRLAAMRGPLPVHVEDPLARLATVRATMDALKESRQAVGAELLAALHELAPPAVLARAARMAFSSRLFNVIVTNVPGPQVPLYLRGRELLDVVPIAFLPRDHALAVAVVSYHGMVTFGLLGDLDALGDMDVIAAGLEASLAELVAPAVIAEGGDGAAVDGAGASPIPGS